ncbi:type I-E CRISPR-associated protein Cas6/Cse3/CasE [Streptomyces triticirhizae]|uniref:Type I-E CRISPR-associated protein Cas6/Cse3/CasE n=1 Tax=Streptomyces triticirhizae TaxID=2483353 RepID=A0A3M2LUA0_9ACTN|nr:type I-E CRISPR-associated protein Cas6/Cse3/CasE [Streptomyces triticirhizae]RMI40470.1 type I-E CRISPR-associated protein Cas6/Cse3/CasE [Streptomyces triticirhizae]
MSVDFVACQSILELSARHPRVDRALIDAQSLHQLVMSGFYGWVPERTPGARAQMHILHTQRVDLRSERMTVVVQSRVTPDWSELPGAALCEKPEVTMVNHRLKEGQRYRFRAVVNPTRASCRHLPKDFEGPRVRKRLADTSPHYAREWFIRRLQPAGTVRPPEDNAIPLIGADADHEQLEVRILPKLYNIKGHPGMRIGRAEVRGELTVTDPAAFARTLSTGLGRAKSYGCGLLLIKPAR